MKFSKETIEVLKNFSTLNIGIELQKGSILKTLDESKAILAEASINEEIPNNFAIYDLNKLLNVIELFGDSELEFKSDVLTISGDKKKVNYKAADRNTLMLPPDKPFPNIQSRVKLSIDFDSLQTIFKVSSILNLDVIAISSDGDQVYVRGFDNRKIVKDDIIIDTDVKSDSKFKCIFKVSNLKMLPGNYEVSIGERSAIFQNKDRELKYLVAIERSSEFDIS